MEVLADALEVIAPDALIYAQIAKKEQKRYSSEQLLVDYAKLFVGPFELIAPPYGSVYLDASATLMGDSTIAVRKMYYDCGLEVSEDFNDLPDHICVELEFMNYLILKRQDAHINNDSETSTSFLNYQVEFLHRFLHRFVEGMCERIRTGCENNFYVALSACLCQFIKNDMQYLKSIKSFAGMSH